MAFEPAQDFSGWLIDDANNDGYFWSVNQYTGVNSSYGAIYNTIQMGQLLLMIGCFLNVLCWIVLKLII